MSTVSNPNHEDVRIVLDPSDGEIHVNLYNGEALVLSLDVHEATDVASTLMFLRDRGWQPPKIMACPAWCTVDHDKQALFEMDLRHHSCTIGEPATDGGAGEATVLVDVTVVDHLYEGTRSEPVIQMYGSGHGDELNAEGARQLAQVLVGAADFLDGHWTPVG